MVWLGNWADVGTDCTRPWLLPDADSVNDHDGTPVWRLALKALTDQNAELGPVIEVFNVGAIVLLGTSSDEVLVDAGRLSSLIKSAA